MLKRYRDNLLLGIFILGFLMLRLFYITRVKGPFVYTDEMGYWGHAANLAGNTWAGVMSDMPWYAFGYSLFLAPLFLISNNIVIMYRMAVILNILFGLLSFALAYRVIGKLVLGSNVLLKGSLAFVATAYSAYIFQSYVAWSETLLNLLVWLIFYELLSLEDNPKYYKGILLGITVGYAYMVHNRMLAVIGAVVLLTVALLWNRKIKIGHFMCIIGAIMTSFIIYVLLKGFFQHLLTDNAVLQELGIEINLAEANTLSGQIFKIKALFSLKGLKTFLLNLVGQLWQFLSATYLIAGFGIVFSIKGGIDALKNKKQISLFWFPLIALLATIVMTSVFFIGQNSNLGGEKVRIDTLFYGRYNDTLIAPLITMGMLWLKEKFEIYHKYVCIVFNLIYLGISCLMYYNLKGIENFYLNTVSAVGIYTFHWFGEFTVWKCTLFAILVSMIFVVLSSFRSIKKFSNYIIYLLLIALFSTTALKCMKISIRGENDNTSRYEQIYNFLNENTLEKELIYTCMREKAAYDLQTRVVDKMVVSIDIGQMELADYNYIVVENQDYNELDGTKYKVSMETEDYLIIQKVSD